MKIVWKIGFISLLIAISACDAYSKSWRGIVPFHSTRADVERILGKAPCQDENGLGYQFETEQVYFTLARGDKYASCTDTITPGTVLRIDITPKKDLTLTDLIVRGNRLTADPRYSWPPYVEIYINDEAGMSLRIEEGIVKTIFYGPERRDKSLCPVYYQDPAQMAALIPERLCPTIRAASPEKVEPGARITFTVKVSGAGRCPHLTFDWAVTVGKIVKGQGTTTIEVETNGVTDNRVIATVTVGGLDFSCTNKAWGTTWFIGRQ